MTTLASWHERPDILSEQISEMLCLVRAATSRVHTVVFTTVQFVSLHVMSERVHFSGDVSPRAGIEGHSGMKLRIQTQSFPFDG